VNELDLAICGVMLVSGIIGLVRGFVREILSLASWILAFGVAWAYSSPVSAAFDPYIQSPSLRVVAAFTALFLVTLLCASIAGYFFHKAISKAGLTGPDRSLGFLFGMVRGAVVVAVVVLLARTTTLPQEPLWKQSSLIGYFQSLATVLLKLAPPDVARQFGSS
jgi:membrane protein required for colicin V production